jgi:uncharacterized protein YndB with AHSA1/START domain
MKQKVLPRKVIRQTVLIPAKPTQVYETLVDPKQHSALTGAKATGRMRVGKTTTAYDGYIASKVLKLVPGRKIVLDWTTSEWPDGYGPSRLEISLAPNRQGTRLTMVHSEVPAAQAPEYAQGWKDYYWNPMKVFFF